MTEVKRMIIMIVISFSYDKGITMIKYRIFLNVTETGNFTKTAERFGYTQSAVSQMMKSLEEELKITLFTRTKHGIHLTSDGKAMLPYIRRLCDDYARILGQSSAINHLDGAEKLVILQNNMKKLKLSIILDLNKKKLVIQRIET